MELSVDQQTRELSFAKEEVLADYRIICESRQASLLGRKEVLTGKAKFGIFGDGKELAQIALAKAIEPGDFRSGYYRDQTVILALGLSDLKSFFAQLYAIPDPELDPASAGRQMNAHFATRWVDSRGVWASQVDVCNSSADNSPTGSQMPRLVGLAYASRVYRQLGGELPGFETFSRGGREIAFGTIGNASCAEGMFWESVNAVGVLQAPMLLSIWDDEYGISVPNELQVAKGDLSELLAGFGRAEERPGGYDLYAVRGWDYPTLCETYLAAAARVREEHVPAIVHVIEMTQPQGHSTSGSHERYKSPERLEWEREHDCLRRFRRWILEQRLASEAELTEIEALSEETVRRAQREAWEAFQVPILEERRAFIEMAREIADASDHGEEIGAVIQELERFPTAQRRQLMSAAHRVLLEVRHEDLSAKERLMVWQAQQVELNDERYSSHLYSESPTSALEVDVVPPAYDEDAPTINGFEILNRCFDAALDRYPQLIAFGEDLGQLGDVNQGFVGLQEKHGALRVADTGIRECTIVGQAIGLAMRGLRPLAEIQYLDYLPYALQIISDDLATLSYRTKGGQKAPVVIRTRGHRLEGIWHSGSPMSGILGLVRGVYVCVPRDMTRAAGFYNTMLRSDDSAIIVEVLNGYRVKETLPSNVGELTVPLGVPEVLRPGSDVTVVTYGACCRLALEAAARLARIGIEVEVIDVQTLLPFDREARIVESLRTTNRVVFVDEDVPGGTTAYMLQEVIENQRGYQWLDAGPRTLSARPHRPAYGSDGDYFSKPNVEDMVEAVYELLHEAEPRRYPRYTAKRSSDREPTSGP